MSKSVLHIFITTAIMALFQACNKSTEKPLENAPFCLSDTLTKMIKYTPAVFTQAEDVHKLSGKIEVDPSKMIKIYPLVGGVVERVYVELGDYVKRGQTLALVKSAEAAEIEKTLSTDSANVAVATKNLQVAEDMFKSGLLTEKDYIEAKFDLRKAKSEYDKSLELFNIYNLQPNSKYVIKSPMDGYIVNKFINAGIQLRSDNQEFIFQIGNLSNVWAIANIYETEIQKIAVNDPATIKVMAYPDREYKGKIDKIYNAIDPITKVLKARINIDNPDNVLKPEMYVNITLRRKLEEKVIMIPSEAVVFDKNRNYVVVYHNPCNIEVREVKIYNIADTETYVSHGIEEGENVVYKNQLLVYNALN